MGGNMQGRGRWLLGAAAILAIALGWYFIQKRPTPDPAEQPATIAPTPETPATEPETAPQPDATPEPEATPQPDAAPQPDAVPQPDATPEPEATPEVEETAPEAEAVTPETEAEAAAPEAVAPLLPSFDVVRIKPDGGAVVAGRTEPSVPVTVLVDDLTTAEATTDDAGNFVALFDLPPADVTRVMTLQALLPDGSVIRSEQSVIIEAVAPVVIAAAPEAEAEPEQPAAPGADAAAAVSDTTEPTGETDAPVAAAVPDTIDPAPAPDTTPGDVAALDPAPDAAAPVEPEAVPEPVAPRILLAGPDGITVMQGRVPGASGLSIDTISYDDGGEVALAGRGGAAEHLQIYLDNLPVRSAEIGPDGQWRAPLPEVDPGVYTLRVDALAPDGTVTSRVETPFKREDPVVLEAAQAEAQSAVAQGRRIASITVQKDDTLWAIARDRYGEGMLYVKVFEANRAQIRDPHWIYPGQVFTLPEDAAPPATK